MSKDYPQSGSNGYEEVAANFISIRSPCIGAATVREWSRALPHGASILELGCGHGVPISQVLINDGFDLYGVDASRKMIAAFRDRFPEVHAECSTVEESEFFNRTFDGVVVSDSLTGRLEYVSGSAKSDRETIFTMQDNEAGSLVLRWEVAGRLLPRESGIVSFQARVR